MDKAATYLTHDELLALGRQAHLARSAEVLRLARAAWAGIRHGLGTLFPGGFKHA